MVRPDTFMLALVSLIATAPLLLVLAIAIRCTLGSPVLFLQRRAGKGGKPFTIVKFRTMTDARGADGELLPDAERTPRFGRFLRRTRFDELPELWNIMRGEMAFIGPRPLFPETVANMGERGRMRGKMLPGLTGWAQVNGNAFLPNEEKLELDLWYVENRSFGVDLTIVARTVLVVLFGDGAFSTRKRRPYASDRRRDG